MFQQIWCWDEFDPRVEALLTQNLQSWVGDHHLRECWRFLYLYELYIHGIPHVDRQVPWLCPRLYHSVVSNWESLVFHLFPNSMYKLNISFTNKSITICITDIKFGISFNFKIKFKNNKIIIKKPYIIEWTICWTSEQKVYYNSHAFRKASRIDNILYLLIVYTNISSPI